MLPNINGAWFLFKLKNDTALYIIQNPGTSVFPIHIFQVRGISGKLYQFIVKIELFCNSIKWYIIIAQNSIRAAQVCMYTYPFAGQSAATAVFIPDQLTNTMKVQLFQR